MVCRTWGLTAEETEAAVAVTTIAAYVWTQKRATGKIITPLIDFHEVAKRELFI
jgi:hypothetical protein